MSKKIKRGTFDPRAISRRGVSEPDEQPENVPIVTYWDIVINAMAKLDKHSIADVDKMTLTEYYCLIHANHEKELYNEYLLHKQAFVSREVEAKKNVGTKSNPKEEWIYKDFNKFFDYEKALNDLRNFEQDKKQTIEKQNQDEILRRIAESNKRKLNK